MTSSGKRKLSVENKVGMLTIAIVVVVLIVALLIQSNTLKKKIVSYTASNEELEYQIQAEKDRAKELELLPDYITSDEFVEKTAREKFGLVYEDEIIFKPSEE